jgi:hypothetical protein
MALPWIRPPSPRTNRMAQKAALSFVRPKLFRAWAMAIAMDGKGDMHPNVAHRHESIVTIVCN